MLVIPAPEFVQFAMLSNERAVASWCSEVHCYCMNVLALDRVNSLDIKNIPIADYSFHDKFTNDVSC